MSEHFDVLVVGAGLAGTTVALVAAARGLEVALVYREPRRESSSWYAQGGMAAAVGAEDSPRTHAEDTLAAARGLADPASVRRLTEEAGEAVAALDLWPAFVRDADGRPRPGLEAGHRHARILKAADGFTGRALMELLWPRAWAHPRIHPLPGTAEALITGPGGVWGAWVTPGVSEDPLPVLAGETVLATGGYAGLYPASSNPPANRGQGLILAYRAGALLADLEFVQFHPTIFHPPAPARPLLLTEALRGAGAHLVDRRGRRIMDGIPGAELAPRDVVAQTIWRHRQATGEEVYLTLAHLPPHRIRAGFAALVEAVAAYGLDLTRDPLPVRPGAHFTMGGIWAGTRGQTTVPGLRAVGEAAVSGIHGANRLASNSLLEAVVFGRRAAADLVPRPLPAGFHPGPAPAPLPAAPAWLGEALEAGAGVARDAAGLEALAARLETAGRAPEVELARLLTRAARARAESRGGHWRTDFPVARPRWQGHLVHQVNAGMRFATPGALPAPDA
ncbi:L-aspartate oxidase [Candidatus Hydrogenisulfobacillus filiaventi]|uniref:L-aspartate oxidase n=1 Tax=Candidatus Hydrogenisulfobacillus filiaventi TaxID=2707344 RepID=A0A6F8ZJC2_9FIRM|nr:FAD-dependent oxidoreductase [Bacillota bacterium]CAB1130089.1 L-aspartate oxidase [Candidatus Hydrogenisulfobacillus filiaventi]